MMSTMPTRFELAIFATGKQRLAIRPWKLLINSTKIFDGENIHGTMKCFTRQRAIKIFLLFENILYYKINDLNLSVTCK